MKPLLMAKPFTRSSEGILSGVCHGIATRYAVDPWAVRLLWLASVFALGTGALAYIVLAICLPRADRLLEHGEKRVLGVCIALSQKTGLDLGLLRAGVLFGGFATGGVVFVAYGILHLILSQWNTPIESLDYK